MNLSYLKKNGSFFIVGGMMILMLIFTVINRENGVKKGDIRGVSDYSSSGGLSDYCANNPTSPDCGAHAGSSVSSASDYENYCENNPTSPDCGAYGSSSSFSPCAEGDSNCYESPCNGGFGCASGYSCDSGSGECSPRCTGSGATQADCSDCGGSNTGYKCGGTTYAGGGCKPPSGGSTTVCCSWCGNCATGIPTIHIEPTEAGQGGGISSQSSSAGQGGGISSQSSESSSSSSSSGSCVGETPNKMTISPPNPISNPATLPGPAVILSWDLSSSSSTDAYNVQLFDSNGNALTLPSGIVSGRSTLSTNTSNLTVGQVYHWRVRAVNYDYNCSPPTYYGAWSDFDYFELDRPPSLIDFEIKNSVGTIVPAENINNFKHNQICQTQFNGDRKVIFSVTVADAGGGSSINQVSLKFSKDGIDHLVATATFDGNNVVSSGLTESGQFWGNVTTSIPEYNNRVVNFPIQFNDILNGSIYNMTVSAVDSNGSEMAWTKTDINSSNNKDRYFKVWDCLVPVNGSLFAGGQTVSCSLGLGYTNKISSTYGFGLSYRLGGLEPRNMTVNSPDYTDGGNRLVWGTDYLAQFTELNGSKPSEMKVTDLGVGGTATCVSGINLTLNENRVSAYSDSPAIRVDFASILNQEAWYQVSGGGINSETGVIDNVPGTCTFYSPNCISSMTINNSDIGTSNNGLVSATTISNNSGCTDCKYGTSRNWSVTKDIVGESYNYKYFYDRYFVNLGQGQVVNSWSDIVGKTGVFFVNGDLNIDADNAVVSGSFLMVIASGNINISGSVNKIEGIFIADKSIIATGQSDTNTQLEINGMLYSNGSNVVLSRTYADKSLNNSKPSVVVNYRPDLVFSLPGKLVKILSGWKEGI